MSRQVELWLYLLAGLAVLELISIVRVPLSYVWTKLLLYMLTLAVAVIGLLTGTFLPCLVAATAMQILFILIPATLISRISAYLLTMDIESGRRLLGKLRYLLWGEPYRFCRDRVEAFASYMKGDGATGDAIMVAWEKDRCPKRVISQARSIRLNGRILLRDWQGTIKLFDEIKRAGDVERPYWLWVSKAYSELGQVGRAAIAIEEARLAEYSNSPEGLALALLPFFALAGASTQCEYLLNQLAAGRGALPEYTRLYWLGRCLAHRGETEAAKETFKGALASAQSQPKVTSAWAARIQEQLDLLDRAEDLPAPSWQNPDQQSSQDDINRVWRIYQNAIFVQEIISPRQLSRTVNAICAVTVAIFVLLQCLVRFGNDDQLEFVKHCLSLGLLDPRKVLSGQYWRLVTYMFLHKDGFHIVVNIIGLLWFGRIAQSIFGTWRFVGIFFLAGIVGGVIHCLAQPDVLAMGNSGAVMGIFGAVGVGIFRLHDYLPAKVRQIELAWLAGLALSGVVIDQMTPYVASVVHLGGMLAGMLFGMIVSVPKPEYANDEKRASV
jgi:membrane associated rhomboid family serine protease